MPSFTRRLYDGWERSLEHLSLALVPLFTALLNTEKVTSVLSSDGFHFGLKLGLPISVVDLWTFVDPPSQGATVSTGIPMVGFPEALLAIPVGVIVQAALSAGYFGSIEDALSAGSFDFVANVRQYFLQFLLLTIIPLVVLLPLALLGLSGGFDILLPLILLLIPVMIAAGYLFYATPYLIILQETDLITGAKRSYELAIQGGPYLSYCLGFLAFVLVISPFASIVVVNLPIVGLLIGLAGSAVLGLAGNFATMRFVADIDPGSPALGRWDDRPDERTGADNVSTEK